jgi:hypothetical protein
VHASLGEDTHASGKCRVAKELADLFPAKDDPENGTALGTVTSADPLRVAIDSMDLTLAPDIGPLQFIRSRPKVDDRVMMLKVNDAWVVVGKDIATCDCDSPVCTDDFLAYLGGVYRMADGKYLTVVGINPFSNFGAVTLYYIIGTSLTSWGTPVAFAGPGTDGIRSVQGSDNAVYVLSGNTIYRVGYVAGVVTVTSVTGVGGSYYLAYSPTQNALYTINKDISDHFYFEAHDATSLADLGSSSTFGNYSVNDRGGFIGVDNASEVYFAFGKTFPPRMEVYHAAFTGAWGGVSNVTLNYPDPAADDPLFADILWDGTQVVVVATFVNNPFFGGSGAHWIGITGLGGGWQQRYADPGYEHFTCVATHDGQAPGNVLIGYEYYVISGFTPSIREIVGNAGSGFSADTEIAGDFVEVDARLPAFGSDHILTYKCSSLLEDELTACVCIA